MNECVLQIGEKRDFFLLNDQLSDWHIIQQEESECRIFVFCLPCDASPDASWSARLCVEQQGLHCRTEIYGLGVIGHSQRLDIATDIRHKVGHGYSSQLLKMVLSDQSQGSFTGSLVIAPGAQQVEAHQTNRNIVLSSSARMTTQPQLEIYADDVQASHGASTGQLDESALFYMQQRGIDKSNARKLLLRAFMDDILQLVEDDTLRLNLEDAVDSIIQ